MVNRVLPGALPLYQKVYQLTKNKRHFVLTTNVDHQFFVEDEAWHEAVVPKEFGERAIGINEDMEKSIEDLLWEVSGHEGK